MNRLAIFDCDGTLFDSQHNICLAMERCFAAAGFPPPPREGTRNVVGLSLIEAMRALLPQGEPAQHHALADGYRTAFQAMRADGLADEPLYDGIAELIDRLEAGGWLLGIATGKSDRGVALALEHHGLAGRFITIQTADRHPSKPHPSMIEQALADTGADAAASLMIGDTTYDMAMARAAGLVAVGVGWGYHSPEALRQAGAHHVAGHPRDIVQLLKVLA